MATLTQAALTAIARQLGADCLPTLTTPLPRELENLLAQLVAYDNRKQKPAWQSEVAQPQPHSPPSGVLID
jgi:hypothetical protein